MKSKSNGISTNIWLYLGIFSILILVMLWFFQIIFLKLHYEVGVKHNLNATVREIKNYDRKELVSNIDNIAYKNDVCIEVISKSSIISYSGIKSSGCNTSGEIYNKFKSDFISDNISKSSFEFTNSKYNNKTIVKAIKIDNDYVFISANLEILENTFVILNNQLGIVTLVILGLSVCMGYFINRKIAKPIVDITEKAEELKRGNYDVNFKSNDGIYEIRELAETLDSTTKELSKTESVRREFLANVSHDIKTPLTMIKAYAEMVRDISYKDDDKRNANLNVIVMEVDRLNILVNDILVLSRLQAGAEALEIEKFDLNTLVKDCLTRYDIYKEDGYEFIYTFNGKSAMIEADKKRMEQVIYNLINNAVQYTGEDKKIFIDVEDSKKWITFSVRDTGKGIKEEEVKHIWDKYYKIDKKYKRSTVGSGIGLSIVKTICENHKFLYGVDTEINHGSKFWVKIRKK